MTKQPCLPHPAVVDWVRRKDKTCFGLFRSFEAAVAALEDLPLASSAAKPQRGFRYSPSVMVPGAYEIILMFEVEGPYLNVQGVGVPQLGIKFLAPIVR